MLGSGIFVLPGLAAYKTGPMVWLAYLVAGLSVLPAALSKSELATAMPTSGGTYVYLERTFGPLAGTISGIGLWLSLLLKSAFALVGFGAYLSVLVDLPVQPVALSLLVVITVINILGVSVISKIQKFILAGVLFSLLLLSLFGLTTMDLDYMKTGFSHGTHGFLAATAFVYVSYAGVTKVAAIAEEVKNPDRNLPLGILISWFTVMCVYVFVVFVLVTNVPMDVLTNIGDSGKPDLHPIYTLACIIGGKTAGTIAAIFAVITMISMAVAGLLAASRFPFAMSRDSLLPSQFKKINSSFRTPVASILLTAVVMGVSILFLPVEQIAKLASAFMILAFMFVCGTVIVLREIASQWYQPRFRSPLYPFIQILGILSGVILLSAMGLTSLFAIGCIILVGAISYFGYGKHQTSRRGVVSKMGKRTDLLNESEKVYTLDEELPNEAAVVVPLFGSERSPETLVEMGASLAHGRKLEVLHLTAVPEQIYLADALEEDPQSLALSRRIHAMAEVEGVELAYDTTATRDVVDTIHKVAGRLHCEWVVMEAAGRRRFGITFQNPLGWLQDHLACNLAVFKDAGVRRIRQMLVFAEPGPNDSLVVTTADHLAQLYNAELNFVNFIGDENLEQDELRNVNSKYIDELKALCVSPTKTINLQGRNELDEIAKITGAYDLMIMGAAPTRSWAAHLMGTRKDDLTRRAGCSVLWLKTAYLQTHEPFEDNRLADGTSFDLLDYVDPKCIELRINKLKKESLFRTATDLLAQHYKSISPIVINSALWEREQLQNTYVGNGVAIPHATLPQAKAGDTAVAIITTAKAIDFGAANKEKSDIFFFTTGSPNGRQDHLKILSALSKLCLDSSFLEKARLAQTSDELIAAIRATYESVDS